MIYRVDLHVHTLRGSADPALCLSELVRAARQAGLDAIAITDTDYCTPVPIELRGVVLIPGCEVSTLGGSILGVFLERPLDFVRLRQHGLPTADETVLEIHRCGGLAILAHPFAQTDANPALFPIRPDAVETACASVVPPNSAAGQRALLWAAEHQRPRVGGSNARSPRELGTVYTEISCPRLSRAFLKEALDLGRCRPVCVRPETTPQSRRPSPARAGKTAASVVKSVAGLGLCRLGGLLPLPRQPKKHPGKKPKK